MSIENLTAEEVAALYPDVAIVLDVMDDAGMDFTLQRWVLAEEALARMATRIALLEAALKDSMEFHRCHFEADGNPDEEFDVASRGFDLCYKILYPEVKKS